MSLDVPNRNPYQGYVFNFRDDNMGSEPGVDAARWPAPCGTFRDLDHLDAMGVDGPGVEAFIREWKAWRAGQNEGA